MNNSALNPPKSRRSIRKVSVVVSFALAFGLTASSASAQVFVTDKLAITSNHQDAATSYLKQGMQYAKQLQEYQTQLQQYQQILTTVQGLATGGILLTSGTLTPISNASNLIQQSCPGANGGGVLGDMTSIVTSSFSQSITTNQQNICAQIVMAQVEKYNKTVKVVNDTQVFGQQLQQLTAHLGRLTTQGDSDRESADASFHSSQIASEMVDWESQMEKYDAIINTLQTQQGILAKVALNGSNTILGNVVQAGAFAAAFH